MKITNEEEELNKTKIITSFILLCMFLGSTPCSNRPTDYSTDQSRTLETLRKVDDYPLYVMRYFGDYDFKKFLQASVHSDNQPQFKMKKSENQWACTCFSALTDEGGSIFGRNFDWYYHPALILHTNPPDGYASVSMVDISYLGFDTEDAIQGDRSRLLEAPYLPFDGMNEHGLIIGMMAVPQAEGDNDPNKVTINSLQAIRLMLDYATNVDEAISLLRKYNIDFGGGPPLHYLIADSSKNSAIVEYIDKKINIIRNSQPWQVATNFVISETSPESERAACWRYNRVYETLNQAEGYVSQDEAMTLLKNVSQSNTVWSIVYAKTVGEIQVAMGRKYHNIHKFIFELTDK